tara:strand:+ start:766 stop:1797 length:1032 start_codon:yes stop_codon:yes gene_type:complete
VIYFADGAQITASLPSDKRLDGVVSGTSGKQGIFLDGVRQTGSGGGADTTLFITEWTVAGADTLTMPTTGSGYSGTVTWKDSLGATVSTGAFTDGDMTPLQAIAVDGVNSPYTCEISGDFPRVYFNSGGDRLLITDVKQWGDIAWSSMFGAFSSCTNLTITATDTPDLSTCTSLGYAFFTIPSFNSDNLVNWSVGNITDFSRMCQSNSSFDVDLSGWDMSSATTCYSMLQGTSFNHSINSWTFGANCNLQYMLFINTSFDQDCGDMDLANVGSMNGMMQGCTLSTANYDATLNGWKAQVEANSDTPASISFHGGNSNYSTAGQTAHNYLTGTASWTITDGGLA